VASLEGPRLLSPRQVPPGGGRLGAGGAGHGEGAAIVDLALVEAANALARRVRAGKVDPATAAKALEGLAEGGGLRVIGFRELLKDALEISSREDLTMQDALFVAAALRLGAELVTADSRQAEVAARLGVPVRVL